MSRARLLNATIVLALLLAPPLLSAQAGTVYKWTDDQGVVHYTDAPPEGREFKRIDAPRPAEPASDDDEAVDADGDGVPDAEAAAAASASTASANCETAKRNRTALAGGGSVAMDLDGDGKADVLSDEQRAAEAARAEQLVIAFCGAEAAASADAEGSEDDE